MDSESLIEAIKRGDRESVVAHLEGDPALIGAAMPNGVTALMMAVYFGQPDIAADFIARGAVLSIHEASATGDTNRVAELLDLDPQGVQQVAADGHLPLGLAAFFGQAEVVDLLLARGAKVNSYSRNVQRVSPLHSAAARGDFGIVKTLLEQGALADVQQESGFTAMHAAAGAGRKDLVELLLKHGARPDTAATDGRTPADLAREKGFEEVVSLLGSPAAPPVN